MMQAGLRLTTQTKQCLPDSVLSFDTYQIWERDISWSDLHIDPRPCSLLSLRITIVQFSFIGRGRGALGRLFVKGTLLDPLCFPTLSDARTRQVRALLDLPLPLLFVNALSALSRRMHKGGR